MPFKRNSPQKEKTTLGIIQKMSFRFQIILIVTLALFLGFAGSFINVQFETERRDQNLQNVAEAVAKSPLVVEAEHSNTVSYPLLKEYLDSLCDTL